jgi:Lon protease-like protein
MSLPAILPLFPLPNVVLFPQVLLPLHIFEPRYREMVKDVAAGEELIGMILLRGPEGAADGRDVYSVGCAGRMVRKVDLADGRSNILLQGVREFVPQAQYFDRSYRTATVTWLPTAERGFKLDAEIRRRLLERIRGFVGEAPEGGLRILSDPTLSDEMLVNLFAFALDFPVAEKQTLLETRGLCERARQLIDTLEFHALERASPPGLEHLKLRVQ